jgi:DNA ligase
MSNVNNQNADVADNDSTKLLGPDGKLPNVPGVLKTKVVDITTIVNSRGVIIPIVHVEPKIKIGPNFELSSINIRSWDDIKECRIFKYGMLGYTIKNGTFELIAVEEGENAKQKAIAVGENVQCPICKSFNVASSKATRRCCNPDCGYLEIKSIWTFLRVCLGIGSIPYMVVYDLFKNEVLKSVLDIWNLKDGDLTDMGLDEENSIKFKKRIEEFKEIHLENLIYGLGINGLKAASAVDLARRIGSKLPYYQINDDALTEHLVSEKREKLVASEKRGELDGRKLILLDSQEPAVAWNRYLDNHRKIVEGISEKVKIIPSDIRYILAGKNVLIGDINKYNRELISDLVRLRDARVVPRNQEIYWPFIGRLIVEKINHNDRQQQEAALNGVKILTLDQLESKGIIKLPDRKISFCFNKEEHSDGLFDDLF